MSLSLGFRIVAVLILGAGEGAPLNSLTTDRASEPPPRFYGSSAASLSRYERQLSPINAHAQDFQGMGSGPPGSSQVVPQARMHATLTAVGRRLFLFGGTAASRQKDGSFFSNDLFVFDATRGAWSDELSRPFCCDDNAVVDALGPRPPPRTQHAAAFDGGTRIFVFGGFTDRVGFNGEPASRIRYNEYGAPPGGGVRAGDGFSEDPSRNGQGGEAEEPVYLNDLHYFDTGQDLATAPGGVGGFGGVGGAAGRMRWSGKLSVAGVPPSPRASHAMVLLVDDDNLAPGTASSPASPAPGVERPSSSSSGNQGADRRWGVDASMAESTGAQKAGPVRGGALFVFGGRSGTRVLNDVHRLDLRTLAWTSLPSLGDAPSPRHYFGACAGGNHAHLFVFGGLWQAVATPETPTPAGLRTFEVVVERTSPYGTESASVLPNGTWVGENYNNGADDDDDDFSGPAAAVNGGTDPRVAVPLDGLYMFSVRNGSWTRLDKAPASASFTHDDGELTLSRHPSPSLTEGRRPSPRYNHALVPLGGLAMGERQAAAAAAYPHSPVLSSEQGQGPHGGDYGGHGGAGSLFLVGGVDGSAGVDLDEVGLFNLGSLGGGGSGGSGSGGWHLNPMTGLTDLDGASSVRGSVSSGWAEWTGHAAGMAARGGLGNTDTWRTSAVDEAAWALDTSGTRRAADGSADEYDQFGARGIAHRPAAAVTPGRDPLVKTNNAVPNTVRVGDKEEEEEVVVAGAGMGGDHVVRAQPSSLASRPEPRLGQAWAVSEDGRLWEFGGRRALVTPATPAARNPAATSNGGEGNRGGGGAAADAATRGSGKHWGDAVGTGDMVGDLHMYSRGSVPAWSGRPHGQGANHKAMGGGRGGEAGPHSSGVGGNDATRGFDLPPPKDLEQPLRQTYAYAGVVRSDGTKQ